MGEQTVSDGGALDAMVEAAAGGRDLLPAARAAALAQALERLGLDVVARLDAGSLAAQCGLTERQATRLTAAFALGRAVERSAAGERPVLRRPGDVARYLRPFVRGLEVETFQVLALDARYRLKARVEVSRGTLDAAPVHPREVYAPALRLAAAALIVAHNHPSGDPEPSPADVAVTERLAGAGRLVGVPLLDHVVLGDGRWVSLRERGPWPGGNGRQDRVSG